MDPGPSQDKKQLLQELIQTYGQDVWNFAYTLTRNPTHADDVSQDVFLKVYQKLETFRGEASIKTWLLTITRNVALDHRRSAFFRRVTLVDTFADHSSRGMHASAESEFFDKLATEAVWNQVLKLPTKLREVLVLAVTYKMPLVEIANLLEVKETTVRTRLHRGKARVSEWMGKEEGR